MIIEVLVYVLLTFQVLFFYFSELLTFQVLVFYFSDLRFLFLYRWDLKF